MTRANDATIPKFKVVVESSEVTMPKFKAVVTMTPDAFLDTFTDSTYCDLQARPKTAKALIKLSERIPDSVVNNLPRIVVFAPNAHDYGLCIPLMAGAPNGADAFIYLAPSLERQSQTEVDFTVAHEFAHAALRHHEPESLMTFSIDEAKKGYLNWNSEVAADELVESWGYEIPKRRQRKR